MRGLGVVLERGLRRGRGVRAQEIGIKVVVGDSVPQTVVHALSRWVVKSFL